MSFGSTFVVNEKYAKYIVDCQNYKYNWIEGAYRSGKSVANVTAFAMYLENCKDKLHLVIASTVSVARAVAEEGGGILGLHQYFGSRYRSGKFKDAECGYIDTPTGRKVVLFLGGSLENSYMRFRGMSVGAIYMTELDLLHENTITEAKGRILMAKDPKVFIDHNPTNPNNKIYTWLEDLQKRHLVNYLHSVIDDNPAMTEQRKNEIKGEFDPDSMFYRRYILGERVVADNNIYTIRDYNIIGKEFDPGDYSLYFIAGDVGLTCSATCYVMGAWNTKTKSLDILMSYYYKNDIKGLSTKLKYTSDFAHDLALFTCDCYQRMDQRWATAVIVDSFEMDSFYRYSLEEFYKENVPCPLIFPIDSNGKTGKDDEKTRIARLSSLLYRQKLRFSNACEETIREFRVAQYDPKELDKGNEKMLDDFDSYGHLDMLDATAYLCTYARSILEDLKI
jgi:PBSX family phage terminase large subunit